MIIDIALHMGLEMGGAVSFACIMRTCKDPQHNHGGVLRWVGTNPWRTQMAFAFILAAVTVRIVG